MKHLRLITWPVWVALLFIAVTAISVFFTYRPFSTYWQAQDRYWVVALDENGITITRIEPAPPITLTLPMGGGFGGPSTSTSTVSLSLGVIRHEVTVPFWALYLLAIPLVAWGLIRESRRALRERRGGCRACGYDLTGNRSGICPECGITIAR